jgi:serine protease AprX
MQLGVEQIKQSATWGGAKSGPTPTDSKAGATQGSRKRSNAKRAAQFLLCFGLMLMSSINASAKKLSKQLSPDLCRMVLHNDPARTVDVIVQYTKKVQKRHLDKAAKHNAKVKQQFNTINGVQMSVPLNQVSDLADDNDVKYVTLNRKVNMNAATDIVNYAVAADLAWSYGYDGRGIGIAVIDSGIASHQDVNQWNSLLSRVVYSESFVSGDASAVDTYGHGTHVAGIAAGNGFLSQGGYPSQYSGVAPAANIINLRVLDANGCGTDSAVIGAIQRAIALKSVYNIRVINLSLGRGVFESFTYDPLDQAVEKAWQAGIVVVVAAGNKGRDTTLGTGGYGTIGAPGNDPFVITVGAMDTKSTMSPADDQIATYSSKGPSLVDHIVKPDLVAPGDQVVSLRVANSTLDLVDPTARVTCSGCLLSSAQYLKLSGTSMATPVVAGAAALLLQKDPTLSPDMVKARLMKTASKNMPMYSTGADKFRRKFKGQYDVFTYGAGYLNIASALKNTDRGTGFALSPRAVYDPLTGQVRIDNSNWASGLLSKSVLWGNSVLWGDSVIWGDSVLWGDSVIWGDATLVNGSSVLWGDSVAWGDTQEAGFSVIWGDSVLWGSYDGSNDAFSESEGGDCLVDEATGAVTCEDAVQQ